MDQQTSAQTLTARIMWPVRRLYDWVLHWADTRYGTPALFVLAFAESSVFPVPPDVLQIALSLAKPARSFFYAIVSLVGSVTGGLVGWLIGHVVWQAVSSFFFALPGFTHENFEYVQRLYQENAFIAILAAAFSPIPYKVFTIAAGVFDVSLLVLFVASLLGRGGRFFAVATCIFVFGPQVKELLDRYFEWAAIIITVMFVAGFAVLKYIC